MPVLELNMQPNDKVFAESGELGWMSMAVQMQTSTSAGGQQGGFLGALGRAVAGGTFFMTEYTAVGGPGLLAFSAKLPGQILPMEIAPGQGYMVHRHGFMCATIGCAVLDRFPAASRCRRVRRKRVPHAAAPGPGPGVGRAPRRGGHLRPSGWEHAARPPGLVGMFQESVQFNITTVPGIQNALFGGSGLFLATLTGPGRIWLQSMSMQHLAHAIQEYLPKAG